MLIGIQGTGNKNAAERMAVECGYVHYGFDHPIKHAAAEVLGLPMDLFVDAWKRNQHNLRLDATPAQAEAKFAEAMTCAFGNDWRLNLWASHVAEVVAVGADVAVTVGDDREAEAVRRLGGRVVDADQWRESVAQ